MRSSNVDARSLSLLEWDLSKYRRPDLAPGSCFYEEQLSLTEKIPDSPSDFRDGGK
jgi:hypothetical protein